MVPVRHTFCSICVRDWLGRGEDHQNCPQCKANRKPNIVLYKDRLKPCMSLDSAARGFKELRGALLRAVFEAGGCDAKIEEEARQRTGRKADSDQNGRRALDGSHQRGLDRFWASKQWSGALKRHPGYHNVKEKGLRQELWAMGMMTSGKKDDLVLRHQTFIKLAEAEADKVVLGRPTRTREQVVKEVEEKVRARSNVGTGSMARAPVNVETLSQHEGYKIMVKEMRRRQKEQKRRQDGIKVTSDDDALEDGINSNTCKRKDIELERLETKEWKSGRGVQKAEDEAAIAICGANRGNEQDLGGSENGDVRQTKFDALRTDLSSPSGHQLEGKDDDEDVMHLQTVKSEISRSIDLKRRQYSQDDGVNHKQRRKSVNTLTACTSRWICQACTLNNAGHALNCAACNVPRRAFITSTTSMKTVKAVQENLLHEALQHKSRQVSDAVIIFDEGVRQSAGKAMADVDNLRVRLRRVKPASGGLAGFSYQISDEVSQAQHEDKEITEWEGDSVKSEEYEKGWNENSMRVRASPKAESPSY